MLGSKTSWLRDPSASIGKKLLCILTACSLQQRLGVYIWPKFSFGADSEPDSIGSEIVGLARGLVSEPRETGRSGRVSKIVDG